MIQEIQQLGLPQENAIVIGAEYCKSKKALQARLYENSHRISRVLKSDWKVNLVHPLEDSGLSSTVHIQLRILIDNEPQSGPITSCSSVNDTLTEKDDDLSRLRDLKISLSKETLDLLIYELSQAKIIMQKSLR